MGESVMDRRAVIGFALGPVGVGLLSFISLPVMAWIFPPEMIGKLSMLQVAIGLSIVSCCLGLDQAYAREYHESHDHGTLLLNATVPGLAMLLGVLMFLALSDPPLLSKLLFGIDSAVLSGIAAACLVIAYLSRFFSVILRMQDRGFTYSMSQILSKLVLLLIVLGYALFTTSRTFMMLMLAQVTALALALVTFGWSTHQDWWQSIHAKLDRSQFQRLLSFGLPLAFAGIATWGVATLDRVFLRAMSTYEELAIYSVAASIAAGVTILASIFNTVWAPLVYRWVADDRDAAKRVDSVTSQVIVVMVIILCLVGGSSWILDYVLPSAYGRVSFLVVGCMISPMFYTLSEVTGIGIAVSRRTVLSLAASGAAVFFNIALCFVLVPRFGALGAMCATACAFWLFFALRTEFSAMTWHRLRRVKVHSYAIFCLLFALAYAVFGPRSPRVAIAGWWVLLGIAMFVDRSIIRNLWITLLRQVGPMKATG